MENSSPMTSCWAWSLNGSACPMPQTVGYAVSKSGMIGLSNILAIEGAECGIKSNIILPGAVTRMAEGLDTSQFPPMGPELVAPVVGYLAHEDCAVTGELYVSMAGRVARAYVTETRGVFRPKWSIDDVAENLGEIRDSSNNFTFHPAENGFFEHMTKSFELARTGA